MSDRDAVVRVRHGVAEVRDAEAPCDRLFYRLFYPAISTGAAHERQTGQLPPDPSKAPWPVVVFMNGINVGPESYLWLATRLAQAGIATMTFAHIGETMPGELSLSPGLDISALTPAEVGTRPSSTTASALIEAIATESQHGPLAGSVDPDRVAFGGHSAGGTAALLNARREWFPNIRAAFAFAGHTVPAALLGHPVGTVLDVDPGVPALLLGGTRDGVIAASAVRYEADGDTVEHDPITLTFEHGVAAPGSTLAFVDGAGHFTCCDPHDPTTARGFLEDDADDRESERRELVAQLVTEFLSEQFATEPTARDLHSTAVEALGDHPLVERFARKPSQ